MGTNAPGLKRCHDDFARKYHRDKGEGISDQGCTCDEDRREAKARISPDVCGPHQRNGEGRKLFKTKVEQQP